MWKDMLKAGAVIAAMFCGTVLLIGFVVPRERDARCEALFEKGPRDVWESLSDIPGWRDWMPGVDYVVALRDRGEHPAYQVTGPEGSIVVEVVESDRPERLVISVTGDGYTKRRTYTLGTLRNLTRLTLEESGELHSPFDRGLTVFDDPHDELLVVLSAFATHLGVNTIPQIVKK